jgi:hypothetical protein
VYKVEPEGKKVAWSWEDWITRSDLDNEPRKNNTDIFLSVFLTMLASLPRPGFLMKNDTNWRVLFEDKTIRKRIVSSHKLRKFYRSHDLDRGMLCRRQMRLSTWTTLMRDGTVLSPTLGNSRCQGKNPVEWIVAIEYGDVAMDKKDAELGIVRLIFVDPQASKMTWPWTRVT